MQLSKTSAAAAHSAAVEAAIATAAAVQTEY